MKHLLNIVVYAVDACNIHYALLVLHALLSAHECELGICITAADIVLSWLRKTGSAAVQRYKLIQVVCMTRSHSNLVHAAEQQLRTCSAGIRRAATAADAMDSALSSTTATLGWCAEVIRSYISTAGHTLRSKSSQAKAAYLFCRHKLSPNSR